MAEYEWVRFNEITFLQYMQMCHRHAEELIDGATTREVYDDSVYWFSVNWTIRPLC